MTELSQQQADGVEKAIHWFNNETDFKPVFKWSGYAGTGKTFAIKYLVSQLEAEREHFHAVYCAFTGKAALAMRKANNVDARTIHSLIYDYVPPDNKACEALYKQIHDEQLGLTLDEKNELQAELDKLSEPRFQLKEESDLEGASLLIIDEASMVSEDVLNDLLEYGVPIIAMGDPGQLPPVNGTGAIFVGEPDVMLTEIHRQAAENPIIKAATRARQGVPLAYDDRNSWSELNHYTHLRRAELEMSTLDSIIRDSDIVLCGMNDTRYTVNVQKRKLLGFDWQDPYPQEGEIICCWKNEKEMQLFNGLMATVVRRGELYDEHVELFIRTDLMSPDEEPKKVRALRAYFDQYFDNQSMKRVKWWMRKDNQEFDFGYCVTVHKSQGSQWDRVCFWDDGLFKGWRNKAQERKQFVYTAITRAAENLTILS